MAIFRFWRNLSLVNQIMVGFLLGMAAGIVFGPAAGKLYFLGDILIRLLTMVVAPLILALLICAAADVGDYRSFGRIGVKCMVTYMGTTVLAIIIGLIAANLFDVGLGLNLSGGKAMKAAPMPSIAETLINIIPQNPFDSLNRMNLLQIIFFALLFGFALTRLGDKGKVVLDFFHGFSDTMKEITNIVLGFSPYGVFGLMATVVGNHGLKILLPYAKIIIALYVAAAIHLLLVQSVLMAGLIGRLNPIRFLKGMSEAAMFMFAACSSVATIPLTLKCVRKLGVSERIANFVIPFGAVINMDGTAIYQAIAAIFTAQIYGISLTITQQIIVLLSATLASIGTAGVPGSGLIMLTIVLTSVGLPLEAVGLLAGIDRILNMARGVPNIVGDAACAVAIARTEGELLATAEDARQPVPAELKSNKESK